MKHVYRDTFYSHIAQLYCGELKNSMCVLSYQQSFASTDSSITLPGGRVYTAAPQIAQPWSCFYMSSTEEKCSLVKDTALSR